MRDSDRVRPGSSSSAITNPDNYDWEDCIRNPVATPQVNWNDQFGNMNTTFDVPPPPPPRQKSPSPDNNARPNDALNQTLFSGESADTIMMRLSNEFSPIVEKGADTLVYLGIPPREPGQDLYDHDHIRNHFERPYLMKSETLRRVDSSKFDKFLGPMSARTERRLKKQGVHKFVKDIDNIKFYIDLSPILNDEEAMTQLAELSVPREALKWHQVAEQYCVHSSQTAGRDDLNTPAKPPGFASKAASDAENEDEVAYVDEDSEDTDAGTQDKKKIQISIPKIVRPVRLCDLPVEEEYTSLRHHTTTSRLLHAIAGYDPKLNSAAKAWSFCMLAKYFDCAQHYIISPWIEGWLLQGNNLNFIQVNPYTAYRIGVAMQSVWLVRCTFAILVGKRALSIASTAAEPQMRADAALFDSLDDDERNRIDHASAALHQRVKISFQQVMSGIWMADAYGVKHLNQLKTDDEHTQHVIDDLKHGLLRYVQRRICTTSTNKADNIISDEVDPIFLKYEEINAYNNLPLALRVLTVSFWRCLRTQDLNVEVTTDAESLVPMLNLINGSGLMESPLQLKYMAKNAVFNLVHQLDRLRFPQHYSFATNAYVSREVQQVSPKNAQKTSPYKVRKTTENDGPMTPTKPVFNAVQPSRPPTMHTLEGVKGQMQVHQAVVSNGDQHLLDTLRAAQAAPPLENPYPAPDQIQSAEVDESVDDSWWSDAEIIDADETSPASQAEKHVQFRNEGLVETIDDFIAVEPPKVMLQASAPPKQEEITVATAVDPALHGQGRLQNEALSFRPRKRTSDAAELHDEIQKAQQQLHNAYHSPSNLPHRYRANIGRLGITPSTLLGHTAKIDEVQATASAAKTFPGPDEGLRVINPDPEVPYSANNEKYGNVSPSLRQRYLGSQKGFKNAFSPSNDDVWQQDDVFLPRTPTQGNFREDFSTPDDTFLPRNTTQGNFRNDVSTPADAFLPSNIMQNLTHKLNDVIKTSLLTPGYKLDGTCDFDIPVGDVKTLLCLDEEEWKYLPLWAGGLDDGSGGVFSDGMDIPDAPEVEDGGFRGGAMGIIPGVGSSLGGSMAGSEFEDVATEVGISTVGKASRLATEGRTATVISLDESVIE